MAEYSHFESRVGRITCTPEKFYNFITDIRNLEQFVPIRSINNWSASSDNCSFTIPPVGSVNVRIASKVPWTSVEYSGEVLKLNNFRLLVNIAGNEEKISEVALVLSSDLNPVLKMMVTEPISKFLEMIISEMEKFNGWN